MSRLNPRWFTLLAAAALVSGCSKNEKTPATPANTASGEAAAPSVAGKVDPELTALLKKFVAQKGRMPTSIPELNAVTDSIPRPPEGYAYEIDAAAQEVKLVKR
ncbi:MAG: hypothetical protein EPO07_14360 [Verrucomicrobia bacterium]|nr:MAG: hypothetical protein EPO07_14360 [Verrucomicrobiota bacterium]